jgi:drug/metabolite transporter (DMT)-like permease
MNKKANASLTMGASDWAQLLLLGALWGASFFFARITIREIEPLTLVFYRVVIAAVALHLWLFLRGVSFRPALSRAGPFMLLALLNNIVPFSLIFLGQTAIGAGLAGILNATTPFWAIIAANVFTSDEKITPAKLAGIGLGIAGTAVMVGPGLFAGLGAPAWAQFCVLGAAFSYGLAAVLARRFRDLPSDVVAAGQFTASTVVMAVLVGIGASAVTTASPTSWMCVVALGLLSTALSYILAGDPGRACRGDPAGRPLPRRDPRRLRTGGNRPDRTRPADHRRPNPRSGKGTRGLLSARALKRTPSGNFLKRGRNATFQSEIKAQGRQLRQRFHNSAAAQQKIPLSVADLHLDSTIVEEEAMPWD